MLDRFEGWEEGVLENFLAIADYQRSGQAFGDEARRVIAPVVSVILFDSRFGLVGFEPLGWLESSRSKILPDSSRDIQLAFGYGGSDWRSLWMHLRGIQCSVGRHDIIAVFVACRIREPHRAGIYIKSTTRTASTIPSS